METHTTSGANQPEASQLLPYLPALYADHLHRDPFLGDYLKAFEKVLLGRGDGGEVVHEAGLEETIADLARLFDPAQTRADFLPWLAGWIGLSLRADLGSHRQREFIANMVQLYRRRGTKENLQKLLEMFTAVTPTITEEIAHPEFQLGVHSTIGLDTYLRGGRPHRFRVALDFRPTVPVGEVLPLIIALRDRDGNPAKAGHKIRLEQKNPKRGTFYRDLNLSQSFISRISISKGETSTLMFYQPKEAGDVILTATADGLQPARQTIRVIEPPKDQTATRLVVAGDTVIRVKEKLALTIALRDRDGKPAIWAQDLQVTLTHSPKMGAFEAPKAENSAPSNLTIPAEKTSAVILYEAPAAMPEAGRILLTATAEPFEPATLAITVVEAGAPATRLVITTAATAGALSTLRQLDVVHALIEAEKPAHTDYELEIHYPTMQIGLRSTLGVDTLLVRPKKEERPNHGE
jgi:phage tail-like protein